MKKQFLKEHEIVQHNGIVVFDATVFKDCPKSIEILDKCIEQALEVIVVSSQDEAYNKYLKQVCASEQLIYLEKPKSMTTKYFISQHLNTEETYQRFAKYYDFLQSDLEYKQWIKFISEYLIDDVKLVEAACGSGKLATLIDSIDYLGFDLSKDMIKQAKINNPQKHFIVEDMCKTTFDNIDIYLCFLDSINYLTTNDLVKQFFENVYTSLKPGGIFAFDIHQESILNAFDKYYYIDVFDDFSFFWKSRVEENNLYHNLVFSDQDGLFHEIHHEVIYNKQFIENLLIEIGFTKVKEDLINEHHAYIFKKEL